MARTKITQTNIANDAIDTTKILNSSIKREDIDTTTAGNAIVTKLLAGTNISLTSTGIDSGTGDVTINVNAIPAAVDYQLEGSAVAQRAKFNITDSSEINFTLTDDVANTRVNISASIKTIDYSKIVNTPTDVATQTSLTAHINDEAKHLTSAQNSWIDAITATAAEINGFQSLKAPLASPTFTGTVSGITKAMVGLPLVENVALSTWAGSTSISLAGTLVADSVSTVTYNLPIGSISYLNVTIPVISTDYIIDTIPENQVKTVNYLFSISSGSSYYTTQLTLLYDGTDIYIDEVGTIFNNIQLLSFNAAIVDTNLVLNVDTFYDNTIIKAIKTLIN